MRINTRSVRISKVNERDQVSPVLSVSRSREGTSNGGAAEAAGPARRKRRACHLLDSHVLPEPQLAMVKADGR